MTAGRRKARPALAIAVSESASKDAGCSDAEPASPRPEFSSGGSPPAATAEGLVPKWSGLERRARVSRQRRQRGGDVQPLRRGATSST